MGRLFQIFIFLVGSLPLSFRARAGRYLGWCYSFFAGRDRRVARLQLDTYLADQGGSKHVPWAYASVGETLLESINMKPLLNDYQKYVEADWNRMDEILARKKGIVILSAHTGNWDLLAACSVKRGYKVSVIGRMAKIAGAQEALIKIREDYGVKTLWRAGSAGMKKIMSALKKGEAIAAIIDQDTHVSSLMIPFFGQVAATPATMIDIARKMDAIIVAPLIFRTSTNHYKIELRELDASQSTEEVLTEFNSFLESEIRKHPSQWVWFHKRWRTDASGYRRSRQEYFDSFES